MRISLYLKIIRKNTNFQNSTHLGLAKVRQERVLQTCYWQEMEAEKIQSCIAWLGKSNYKIITVFQDMQALWNGTTIPFVMILKCFCIYCKLLKIGMVITFKLLSWFSHRLHFDHIASNLIYRKQKTDYIAKFFLFKWFNSKQLTKSTIFDIRKWSQRLQDGLSVLFLIYVFKGFIQSFDLKSDE